MTHSRKAGALLGGLAALALGITGVAGIAPAALTPAAQADTSVSLIDSSKTATLTVHKYTTPYVTTSGCDSTDNGGAALDSSCFGSANKKLSGVTFTITKVPNVDLTTNAGWTAAEGMTAAKAKAAIDAAGTAATASKTTDANGEADFTGLSLGLYYVQETDAPANVTKSAAFVVTLPMTNAADTGWNYDVNVYPKNSVDTITKTVSDAKSNTAEDATAGASGSDTTIDYTLLSTIDSLSATAMGYYEVRDQLASTVTLSKTVVTIVDADGNTLETLASGTDYTLATSSDNLVTIDMTSTGLGKLATEIAANPGAQVKTVLAATVDSEGSTGAIQNTAGLIPNETYKDSGATPIPSDTVTSRYGDVTITKQASDGTKLEGATFAVYRGAVGGDSSAACSSITAGDGANSDNLIGTAGATSSAGTTTFKGLQASNFYDNATQTDLQYYCLVETKAPSGYQLLANPITFTVTADTANLTLPDTAQTVTDEKDNLANSLPSTGGMGIIAILVVGAAAIGGGIWTSRRNKKRKA